MEGKMRLVVAFTAAATAAAALTVAAAAGPAGNGTAGTTSAARAATAAFRTLGVAKKDGYALLKDKQGIACIAMAPMPGMKAAAMGVHFAKSAYVGDGRIDALEPDALVYSPEGGKLRLAALEYVVLRTAWDARHATAPELFGHRFNITPAGNRFGLPAFYSLHVWLWKHNPAGEFSMWNPGVQCK